MDLVGLRRASYGLFRNAGTLLVRPDAAVDSPERGERGREDRLAELAEQIKYLELKNLRWGLLHQPVGGDAWVEGDIPEDEWPDLMDRARAIEVEALLDWGDGIWKPSDYHYRLPSGEHAAGFVRVADAIQRPRDAEAIASWMHADLGDGVGLVVDTGTLSSVVQALLAAIRSKDGWQPGKVNVLDGYPATAFDVARALRNTEANRVLVLLSVNSSGRVRGHLIDALHTLQGVEARTLHILVAKQEIESHSHEEDDIVVHTWHPRPSFPPLVRYDAESADVCELCRNTKTATLIPISPRSFDGSLPAALAKVTPDVADGRKNRELWELCDSEAQAIVLDVKPRDELKWRPPGRMPIVIDHERLLGIALFREAAVRSLTNQLRRNHCRPDDAELVLMPHHEFAYQGRAELITEMADILGSEPNVRPFPPNDEWPPDLREEVRAAGRCIAVVTLGTVTGTTLHSALAAVQSARDPGRYDLYAYVVHARLAQRRAWETLQNSYDNSIFAAWHSYLPDRSALAEEASTLNGLSTRAADGLSQPARDFLAGRRRLIGQERVGDEFGLFWGTERSSGLTPNSIFGQSLTGPTVYVAVASAMERARGEILKGQAAPARRVFEMPAIVRSYYDPMILAAVLRWLKPHEAWWGNELADEGQVVSDMLERATLEQQKILVPELLLAAAQGKLNRPGVQSVQARADALLGSGKLKNREKAPIQLGLALIPSYGTGDDHRKESRSAIGRIEAVETPEQFVALMPLMLQDLQQGKLSDNARKALEDKAEALSER